MFSRLIRLLFVATTAFACERQSVDVLQEFPPPRLARETPAAAVHDGRFLANCDVTWRWFGKTSRQTYHLPATGSFRMRGATLTPWAGEVVLDTSAPELPASARRALFARGGTTWTWRLLGDEAASAAEELGLRASDGAESDAKSELELNAVRTRQSHRLRVKLTSRENSTLRLDTQLKLDLGAHHLHGLELPDGSPPRRTDLDIQCRLDAPSDAG